MSITEPVSSHEIAIYIDNAHQMLDVATHNLRDGFYASAINRAYYAIFYATSAVLVTQGLSRSKHSGVIAAFRQRFIKPGLIEAEYGEIYGRVMDDRHTSDYDLEVAIEMERAQTDLEDAQRFVSRVERYLQERDWL